MDLASAKKILKKVESDYDAIAREWDMSRSKPWAYQVKMLSKIKKEDKILDVGCGNGLLYDILADKSIDYTGMDISSKLLFFARKRINKVKKKGAKVKIIKGDIIKIPSVGEKFDWVLALAVLHHIPSKELQEAAVKEIYRVLKPGGQAVVSVWNLYSDYAEKKFGIKEQLKNIPKGWSKKDLSASWKATPKKNIQRYLYCFDKKEFSDLFKKVGFKKNKIDYTGDDGSFIDNIKKSWNITAIVKK